jgi:hypothetical protein
LAEKLPIVFEWVQCLDFLLQVQTQAILKRIALITALVVLAVGTCASGQGKDSTAIKSTGWQKIGDVISDFSSMNESVVVLNADKYRAIKLKVTDAPITIERGAVHYTNGDVEYLFINRELVKDGETGSYNLRRPPESLDKVSFWYKTMPNYRHDKAHVEVYGLK